MRFCINCYADLPESNQKRRKFCSKKCSNEHYWKPPYNRIIEKESKCRINSFRDRYYPFKWNNLVVLDLDL